MTEVPTNPAGYGDCEWPYDTSCLGDDWWSIDEEVQTRAVMLASSTLRRLTGYRVGGCPIKVRPCMASACGCDTTPLPDYWMLRGHYGFAPQINSAGVWVNSCGCRSASCSCQMLCEVVLPPPIGVLYEVRVDGTVVDPADYTVYSNRLVWANPTLDCPWPACQDLRLPDTEVGTFSVTYLNAYPVDGLGAYAVGILTYEYSQACMGNTCRLPSGVTSVSRQGVSFTVEAGAFPNGFTGIREVDAFIALWNPNAQQQATRVWAPGMDGPWVTR